MQTHPSGLSAEAAFTRLRSWDIVYCSSEYQWSGGAGKCADNWGSSGIILPLFLVLYKGSPKSMRR